MAKKKLPADVLKVLNKIKKASKGAWHNVRAQEAKPKGATLPDNLVDAVCKLDSYKFAEDKNGNPYIDLVGILQEAPHKGKQAHILHFIRATQRKTVEDKLGALSNDIQLLGGDISDVEFEDLPSVLDELIELPTFFTINTWRPQADKNNPNPGVFIFVQNKVEDYEPLEDEDEDEDEEQQEDEEPEEEEDWEPDEDEVYLYKRGRGKPQPYRVAAIDSDKETCTLVRVEDGVIVKNVPWDRLIDDEEGTPF